MQVLRRAGLTPCELASDLLKCLPCFACRNIHAVSLRCGAERDSKPFEACGRALLEPLAPLDTRAQKQCKQLRAHRFNRVSYLLRKSWYVMIVSFISQHTPDLLASSLACLRRLGISSASTAVIGPPRMHTISSTPECSCDSMLIVRLTATQYLPCDW